nr:hypothetical protein CoNPh37_CDS0161 [Staphylococcus phage S-CoN_Ph37]
MIENSSGISFIIVNILLSGFYDILNHLTPL